VLLPKKVFFAKRTQSCSMFTAFFEKQSARKPHQNRIKTHSKQLKTDTNEAENTPFSPLAATISPPCPHAPTFQLIAYHAFNASALQRLGVGAWSFSQSVRLSRLSVRIRG
jgi:hypothetical protein